MRFEKIFGIFLGLYPVLDIYALGLIPGLSIGQFIMLYFCCRTYLDKNNCTVFIPFVLYSIIITFFSWLKPCTDVGESMYELIALILFFFLLNGSLKKPNYDLVKKTIIKVGIFSCCFFYIQYILRLFGVRISGLIIGLPMSNGGDSSNMAEGQLMRDRISSIFQEPAHYANFIIILLIFILFSNMGARKKTLSVIAVSVSILLCQSAGGYVLLLLALVFWVLYVIRESKGYMKVAVWGCMIIIIPIFIYLFTINEKFMGVLLRFQNLSFTPEASEHGYSSYIRLFRGYIPIMEGSKTDLIFGKGIGTLLSYVRSFPNSDYLSITDYNPNWINSFQFILLYTGIIGCVLFFSQMFKFYKKSNIEGRLLVLIYITALFSTGILLTASSLLYIFLIYNNRMMSYERNYNNNSGL